MDSGNVGGGQSDEGGHEVVSEQHGDVHESLEGVGQFGSQGVHVIKVFVPVDLEGAVSLQAEAGQNEHVLVDADDDRVPAVRQDFG